MKRTFFLIVSLLMMCMIVHAQDIRDGSNMLIGKIESDGTVRDRSNMMIGKFGSDGTVVNRNNMMVGKIERDGTIRDRSNMMMGKVDNDGDVKDKNNMMIGKVESDGTVGLHCVFFYSKRHSVTGTEWLYVREERRRRRVEI